LDIKNALIGGELTSNFMFSAGIIVRLFPSRNISPIFLPSTISGVISLGNSFSSTFGG
jgi:hypothetical protein